MLQLSAPIASLHRLNAYNRVVIPLEIIEVKILQQVDVQVAAEAPVHPVLINSQQRGYNG